MPVQRILEVTRDDVSERVGVSSAIEMFSFLLDPTVTRVEMVWDAALGEKRMTFKRALPQSASHRVGKAGNTSVSGSGTNGPLPGIAEESEMEEAITSQPETARRRRAEDL